MCLNNWHYINEKVLSFHENINFFTGHSGSGKSTVLDALQIVLYADSNGRGFFNKAAKEDSDRSLIEYLRGMKVVQENDVASYLRNKNFSTTIVLEFHETETDKYQSIGIVFDVDVSVNDINRMFFWHKGQLATNCYRDGDKVLSINELKEYLKDNYNKEEYFISRTNEKFRNEMFANYFGGLHEKHFPALFKKAIPFKMDMKLEDFVKNYICVENDIHIEDMQDSVAQYTRLKRKLEDTKNEISMLSEIQNQFESYFTYEDQTIQYQYNMDKIDIQSIKQRLDQINEYKKAYDSDVNTLNETISTLENQLDDLQKQRDEVLISIQNSGYDHIEKELISLNQLLEFLILSKSSYDKIANRLKLWLLTDYMDQVEKDRIQEFIQYNATATDMEMLQSAIQTTRANIQVDKDDLSAKIKELTNQISDVTKQINMLQSGQKAYPIQLLEAKDYITEELEKFYETPIQVDILADLLEIKDNTWRNAVEGYMGNNKLTLMVPPQYAKKAMEIYKSMEPERYYNVAVVDTEKVVKEVKPILKGALAEEISTSVDYAKAYADFLLGAVIKCDSIDQLRENKSGITADCVLYQGYKIQHINPRNYTEHAYIGRLAIERRLVLLKENLESLLSAKKPLDINLKTLNEVLSYESFSDDINKYEKYLKDIKDIPVNEHKKQEYELRIKELKGKDIVKWKEKQGQIEQTIKFKSKLKESSSIDLSNKKRALYGFSQELIGLNEELVKKENEFVFDQMRDETYNKFIEVNGKNKLESIRNFLSEKKILSEKNATKEYETLITLRERYLKSYAYRGFSLTRRDNHEYNQLLNNLSSDKLNEFMDKANEQAKVAIYHFKTDFIYKIRDAIKEVMQQKDDLNRILAQLDFGKDRYKFVITRNKGEEGKFYDMFMDENLDINPYHLNKQLDNQMNLFSLQHNESYGDLINELIGLFMPPESSDPKILEQARMNMEMYSDYRTYLSFDMEQLVEGMPPMRLSKMLSKNSGGEGQNPLYVALLASFAQVYRISLKANVRRRPTPRLVVLDEAFSKMDAEKVGSCIGLIRKLGFQAIISATNDKIQNYVDNVDKTFVYANPNKNRISIQEFEKHDFKDLIMVDDDDDEVS
jgi:uncharacterized protein YPO0396